MLLLYQFQLPVVRIGYCFPSGQDFRLVKVGGCVNHGNRMGTIQNGYNDLEPVIRRFSLELSS
jgi:hypothetical protein